MLKQNAGSSASSSAVPRMVVLPVVVLSQASPAIVRVRRRIGGRRSPDLTSRAHNRERRSCFDQRYGSQRCTKGPAHVWRSTDGAFRGLSVSRGEKTPGQLKHFSGSFELAPRFLLAEARAFESNFASLEAEAAVAPEFDSIC
jgi:hypothetical protein